MNETQFTNKILRPYLKGLGFHKIHKTSERFSSGWPDLTCIHYPSGATIYIEAKVDKNVPTPSQMSELVDLSKCGAHAYVFTYLNTFKEFIIEQVASNGAKVLIKNRTDFTRRYNP